MTSHNLALKILDYTGFLAFFLSVVAILRLTYSVTNLSAYFWFIASYAAGWMLIHLLREVA